ncbi:MAG TPA: hypothetical protein VGD98_15110 [Ktedonobacteraceae bacterium]
MQDEAFNHTQAFQQAIATTITCRTLIKYNSNLSATQKEEILNEIETTLVFLSKRLEINASIESNASLSPEKLADLLVGDDLLEEDEALSGTSHVARSQEEHEISLRHLHRLYKVYLSNEPGKGIAALEARYRTVMNVLDQLQQLAELRPDATASDLTVDSLLVRVRGFVTALYCMFREFAALFTKMIEGQSLDIDTEAMALVQEEAQQLTHDITPLMHVYNKQHQVQQHKGPLCESARDATAFLIFLQESLEQNLARRQEIVTQLKSITNLLNDLSALLTDYEQAMASIMQSPSKLH